MVATRVLHGVIEKLEDSFLFDRAMCPFAFFAHRADPASRVLVIAGDNATGKSLMFRHVAQAARDEGFPVITISIRERTGAGSFDMAGMRRMMMFGDESQQSTGQTSYSVTKRGFANIHQRLRDNPTAPPTLLLLDEPELGMSESYTAAMGEYLAQEVNALPPHAPGLVVVTHSKALVRRLCAHVEGAVHFLHAGADLNLDAWLAQTPVRTVADLENLNELGHAGRKAWDRFNQEVKRRCDAMDESASKAPSASAPSAKGKRPRT